jgi:uncharacterized protein YihD (DUF1040 family)
MRYRIPSEKQRMKDAKINEVISALSITFNTVEKADRLMEALPFINRICYEIGFDKPAKHLAGCVISSAISHFKYDGPDKHAAACVLWLRNRA